ncbi:hypothetical protein [Bacillus phage CP-51]|uniref:Uncharacterized protein n=1 Tax=Bacillus phage CP-51 TaxID=1391188 RepID=A0A068EUB9_9CAUD|nr:hypothetical protein OZ73_gp201 [Bacillus phage CP-51]AID50636.1 hypothetical protein [Bacillus phage CP-51]
MLIARLTLLFIIIGMMGGAIYLFTQGGWGYFFGAILMVVSAHFAEDFYNDESQKPVMITVDAKNNWNPKKGDDTKWK